MKFSDLLSKEKKQEIILLKKEGLTIREIAEQFSEKIDDADQEQVFSRVKSNWDNYKRKQGELLSEDETPVEVSPATNPKYTGSDEWKDTTYNEDGTMVSDMAVQKKKVRGYDPSDILKMHGLDPMIWTLTSCRFSEWEGQNKEGKIVKMTGNRITAAPRSVEAQMIKEIIDLNEQILSKIPVRARAKKETNNNGLCAIVSFPDFHLDKREANNTCMSFEKQVQRFHAILGWYVYRLKQIKGGVEKILFYWSQDFFNYDYLKQETTSRKNMQDASVGYQTMVATGNLLLHLAVKTLEEVAPVDLFYTASNHCQQTEFNTMCGLYMAFKDDPNVTIDGMDAEARSRIWNDVIKKQKACEPISYDVLFDATGRHYFRWGDCLFGFAHGDMEKKRIFNLMQIEASEQLCRIYAKSHCIEYNGDRNDIPGCPDRHAWDDTKRHIFFCGHYHSKQIVDNGGVEVIYLGTEMTGDAWHNRSGYLGAMRRIELFVYGRDGAKQSWENSSENIRKWWESDGEDR